LALNKDKKNIEDLNKKIERLETATNEFQSIKGVNYKHQDYMNKKSSNGESTNSISYSSVASKNESEWKLNTPKHEAKQNNNQRKIQIGKKQIQVLM
jgi:hypothetical protein